MRIVVKTHAMASGDGTMLRILAALFAWIVFSVAVSALCSELHAAHEDETTASIREVFSPFAELLKRHLVERDLEGGGLVSAFDYHEALERDDTMALVNSQREKLAAFDTGSLDSREKGNAFWLNAYNFFMVAHILQERPKGQLVETVWDYGGRINPFRDNVFERELFEIGGTKYSLDQIEKETLLGEEYWERGWAEARVHFAVNCASVGCPPLREKIYTPDNLEALLTENTRRALNTPLQLQVEGDTLFLSSLFDWYEEDFQREEGSVMQFIEKYADDHIIEQIRRTEHVEYIDYDWTLNAPGNFPQMQ
ncbi:MAG: DUF547 domain-containing protein [Desulfovibrionales bacterium]